MSQVEQKKVSIENKKTNKTTIETKLVSSSSDLPKNIFSAKVNSQVIFDVIMSERASIRQGTHKVKTRGEVRGGGKKPFRQKGTGNARQGSIRSPQWVGGGVVWGPNNSKNYKLKINKKVYKIAFASALTIKAKNKAVFIHDFKINDKPNTKSMISQIENLKLDKTFKKILIVTSDQIIFKSVSNLEKIVANKLSSLTVEQIVNADVMIFSKISMEKLGGRK